MQRFEGQSLDLPHQRKNMGSAEISLLPLLSLTNSHAHTFMHRHRHTVSSMSEASQQQVSEDRGHLCASLPLLSSAPGYLCWGKTGRVKWADRLPLSSYVRTIKTQNSFTENASALASRSNQPTWSLPPFSLSVVGGSFSSPQNQLKSFFEFPLIQIPLWKQHVYP